jgi:uncharacterized protein
VNISLVLNHQCNLRCRYCYTGRKFDRAMPLATAKKAVDFGFEHSSTGHLVVSFFGGEPMLEIDLMETVADHARVESRRRAMTVAFSISTNGTLLDERRLRFLRDASVHVQVSIDGAASAQDRARPFANGAGSFADVDRNVRRLAEARLLHQLVAVMTPETTGFLSESFRYLTCLDVPEVYFAANFLADWNDAACAAFERAFHEMTDAYAELFRADILRRVDPLFGKIVTHLVRGKQAPRRCGFGQEELAVSPAGNIYPCDRMVREDDQPGLQLGSLDTGLDRERAQALQAKRQDFDPECKVCDLRSRCFAWCGCAQVETTGELGRVSPLFCWFERLFIAEADRLANTLFAERNPTFLREFYRLEAVPADEAAAPALQPR